MDRGSTRERFQIRPGRRTSRARTGRGILLMTTFMDDVRYYEAGNEVMLLKRQPVGTV